MRRTNMLINTILAVVSITTVMVSSRIAAKESEPQKCFDDDDGCPEGWFHLTTGQCVKVMEGEEDHYGAKMKCQKHGAVLPNSNMTEVLRCLKELNAPQMNWLSDDMEFGFKAVYNLTSNKITHVRGQKYYKYVCVMESGHKPLISALGIQRKGEDEWTSDNDQKTFRISQDHSYTLICEQRQGVSSNLLLIRNGEIIQSTLGSPWSSQIITYSLNASILSPFWCNGKKVNFTCKAENGGEEDSHGVEITMQCPPKVVSFTINKVPDSSDVSSGVRKGDGVILNCTVEGYPTPTVSIWRKRDDHIVIKENTTRALVGGLPKLQCVDMGTYVCEAKQDKAWPDGKTMDLGIHGCEPHLCNPDKTATSTQVLKVDATEQTKTFSVCVMAYPRLHETAAFKVIGA